MLTICNLLLLHSEFPFGRTMMDSIHDPPSPGYSYHCLHLSIWPAFQNVVCWREECPGWIILCTSCQTLISLKLLASSYPLSNTSQSYQSPCSDSYRNWPRFHTSKKIESVKKRNRTIPLNAALALSFNCFSCWRIIEVESSYCVPQHLAWVW